MMATPAPVLRKFNPGTLQSDAEVIKQFVVRHREFGILMDILRNNAGASICQHTLIIAPRGRGKTMMLARIAAELRNSEALRQNFLPVRFMEESYEVFNAGEFWLDALFHLVPEVAQCDAEMADELREAHAEFARRWRGRDLEEQARAVVLDTAQRLGRKLVLMVENCQRLFDDVDKRFGWSLRKTLQTEPDVMFLGTATARIAALEDVREPLYEFFRPLLLEPLPLNECKALWDAASGESRSEREIRPLQILTGGDPRLLVIIAGFARHRSLKELLEELVSLIDDHTEYFRSHLEGLGKTERRVYLALVDLWRPSTTAEIAARSMQEIRAVSSLLGRLVKRGAVGYEGKGQKRLYSATQRLYSIYYKLRRQRDEAAVVRSLIHWMVAWYTHDELSMMDQKLAEETTLSAPILKGFRLALRDMPTIRQSLPEMTGRIEAIEVDELVETAMQRAAGDDPAAALPLCEEVVCRFGSDSNLSPAVAQAFAMKAHVHRRLENFDDAIAAYDDLVARFGDDDAPELRVACCEGLRNKAAALIEAGRPIEAIETYSHLNEIYGADVSSAVQERVAIALVNHGLAYALARGKEAAVAAWDHVVTRFGNQGPRFHDAVVLALAGKSIYLARLGDTTSALATSAELARRFGDSDDPFVCSMAAQAFVYRSELLVQLNRADEALATIEDLVGRLSTLLEPLQLQEIEWIRARALLVKGERTLALDALQSAYDSLIVDENTPAFLLHHVAELLGCGLTEEDLLRILTSDSQKCARMTPIVAALELCAGKSVRIPAEMLELAQDLKLQLVVATASAEARYSGYSLPPEQEGNSG